METVKNTGVGMQEGIPRAAGTEQKELICLAPDASLADAARLMRRHHIGDVIVIDKRNGKATPVGIITDRDIALEAESRNLEESRISGFMNKSLATAQEGDDVLEMIRIMKESGVTRLPLVAQDGSLAGIVTAKGLLRILVKGLSDLTEISGRQQANEKRSQH